MELILDTVVIAVFLGILAQVIAEKLRLPAIMPLLILGIAAGPFGLGFLHPDALGKGLEVFIHLGVAIILFEGGLSIDPGQLRRVSGPLRNLLTIGTAVTLLGSAWLARAVTGMPWGTAALFGAIMTVTGPTVVVPLLRHMVAPRKVRTLLVSEGLIIDPIGAVLAYLVLQSIQRTGLALRPLAEELVVLCAVGAVAGFVAGSLARLAARSRLLAGELRNLAILALLLTCYAIAEALAPQSGILAAVVMGFTMSAADIPDLGAVKVFKGQLTMLLISVLFILLAGQLDLVAMLELGWKGLAVVAGLILMVRPLAVAASVRPSQMDRRGRAVVALTAPRGIVAAAVASLATIELRRAGMGEGATLVEGLTYLAILVTGAWATAMAMALPRLLGFHDDPTRRLTVLVGANPLTTVLAAWLRERGRTVVVVDSVAHKLEPLRKSGVITVAGDARDAATHESAGVERDTDVLALTTNDELNLLVAELVREEFGVDHPVVALERPSEEFGRLRRAWMDPLGGHGFDVSGWMRRLENERAEPADVELPGEEAVDAVARLLRQHERDLIYVCGWNGAHPSFRPRLDDLGAFQRITVLVRKGDASEALAPYLVRPVEEPPAPWEGPLPEEEEPPRASAG